MKYLQISCLFIIYSLACTVQIHAMSWKKLSHFKGRVWSVSFSPSGKYFATSSAETRLTIFDHAYEVLWQTNDLIKEVSGIKFSPDEQYLAIPKYKNETDVGLIDLNNFQLYYILSGHTDWVTCIDFTLDSSTIATGSDDATIRIWNKIGSSFMLYQQISGHGASIANLCFSRNANFLAVCGKNIVRIYQKEYNQYVPYQTLKIDARFINGLAFHPNNKLLAVGTYDGKILIFQNKACQFKLFQHLNAHSKMVHCIDFTSDGQYMATGSWDARIIVWKQHRSKFSKSYELLEHKKEVYDIDFHPDGNKLASGSEDNTVLIWKLKY